jgi:hypothetical protein
MIAINRRAAISGQVRGAHRCPSWPCRSESCRAACRGEQRKTLLLALPARMQDARHPCQRHPLCKRLSTYVLVLTLVKYAMPSEPAPPPTDPACRKKRATALEPWSRGRQAQPKRPGPTHYEYRPGGSAYSEAIPPKDVRTSTSWSRRCCFLFFIVTARALLAGRLFSFDSFGFLLSLSVREVVRLLRGCLHSHASSPDFRL